MDEKMYIESLHLPDGVERLVILRGSMEDVQSQMEKAVSEIERTILERKLNALRKEIEVEIRGKFVSNWFETLDLPKSGLDRAAAIEKLMKQVEDNQLFEENAKQFVETEKRIVREVEQQRKWRFLSEWIDINPSQLDFSLVSFNKLLASFQGRDKIGRMVQYFCRFMKGILIRCEAPEQIRALNWSLFTVLMNARRTYRWLASVPHIVSLRDGLVTKPWGADYHALFILAKTLMITWPIIDHYRFLVLIKWSTRHTQAQVRNVSYKLFALAQIITAYVMLRKAMSHSPIDERKRSSHRQQFVKAALTSLTIGHVSEFPGLRCGEIMCGFTGALASLIDVFKLWPKKSLKSMDTVVKEVVSEKAPVPEKSEKEGVKTG
eukprot:g399.t1